MSTPLPHSHRFDSHLTFVVIHYRYFHLPTRPLLLGMSDLIGSSLWHSTDAGSREELDLKDPEKVSMPRDSVQVYEVASPDFTAPPRYPEGRGGVI